MGCQSAADSAWAETPLALCQEGQAALEDTTAGDERLLKGKSLLGWGGVRKGFLRLREENSFL